MWVDSETDQDLVNYGGIARTVTNLVLREHMNPITIGIHGDWGYGKSSVLKMIQKQLADHETVLALSFNGWAFEGFEDAKIALMDSILSELAGNQSIVAKAKNEIVALAKRVRWFKVARQLAGVAFTLSTGIPNVTDVLAGVGTDGKDDASLLKDAEQDAAFRHIHEFREAFARAIDKAEISRLVIFVDDLDRCLPDTAIGTLEAIRLFLSVKNTVFVIGADEGMIEYSVRRHFPELSNATGSDKFTRNYLEKLIQIPIRLPQLTSAESRRFITLLLAEDALRNSQGSFEALLRHVEASDKDPWKELDLQRLMSDIINQLEIDDTTRETLLQHVLLAGQIARPLADKYVGNPRQLKRFLNTMMIRIQLARAYGLHDRVKMGALAKLMLLERREPDAYTQLSRAVAESVDTKVARLKALEEAVREHNETEAATSAESLFGKDHSDWLPVWAGIEPSIGDDELAPYFFVSRERLAQFVGSDAIAGDLQSLVHLFATGKRISVGGQQRRIDALTPDSAGTILEALLERVAQRGEYTTQPDELRALDVLLNGRPALQTRVLTFLEQLPISVLGVWAPIFAVSIAKSESSKPKLAELINRWKSQRENAQLSKAVESAVQVSRSN